MRDYQDNRSRNSLNNTSTANLQKLLQRLIPHVEKQIKFKSDEILELQNLSHLTEKLQELESLQELLKKLSHKEQLASLSTHLAKSFNTLQNYIENYPDQANHMRSTLQDAIEDGWCMAYYYSDSPEISSERQHAYALINYIATQSNHLPVLFFNENIPFFLDSNSLEAFNSLLRQHLIRFTGLDFPHIEFNSWNNDRYQKLSTQEIFTLLNLKEEEFSHCQEKLDFLRYYFNNSQFTNALREIIENGKSPYLNLSALTITINRLYNNSLPLDKQEEEELQNHLETQLLLIIKGLKDYHNNYSETANGLQLDILAFNESICLYKFSDFLYNYDYRYNFNDELDILIEHYNQSSDCNMAIDHLRSLLNMPSRFSRWLDLSEASQIDKYDLLFNPRYTTLFVDSHLEEIEQLLSSQSDLSNLTITPNILSYFTPNTPQYDLYQTLKSNTGNTSFRNHFQNLENLITPLNNKRKQDDPLCQEADVLPTTSSVSPSSKRLKNQPFIS
jgi:hypothetical protein